MLKGLSLLFALLFSIQAHSSGMRCDESLFGEKTPAVLSKAHDYDSYLPEPTFLEGKIREFSRSNGLVWPARSGYEPEVNYLKIFELTENDPTPNPEIQIELYSELLSNYSNALNELRRKDDDITVIGINHINFTEENVLRVREVVAALMYYSVLYMKKHGIQYELVNYDLRLSTQGNHFLNKKARDVKNKSDLVVGINPLMLLEAGAAGGYIDNRKTIYYNSQFLIAKSIFQNDVGYHEYMHHVDFALEEALRTQSEELRPFIGKLFIRETTPEIAKALSVYKKGFSVDELRTFRASMRVLIHEALTLANNKELTKEEMDIEFKSLYGSIRFYNKKQMNLAHLVRDVYERRVKDPSTISGRITLGSNQIYDIGVVTNTHAKSTYELAEFVYTMAYLFEQSLSQARGNKKEMKRVLTNITKVITTPEVRRMNGNYPSIESVIKTLESKP